MATEEELRRALLEICDRASNEAGVRFNRLRRMLREQDAQATAEQLLEPWRNDRRPRGFQQSMEAGRPDLTVEHVVLRQRFRDRFNRRQLGEARYRLGLQQIAAELNLEAVGRPIGELQRERSARHNLTVVPSLFDGRTMWERYAFHVGGAAELQFNIAFEDGPEGDLLRHGVAFSLQATRSMPDISVLIPRVRKFNEFLRAYPDAFADLSMWHFEDHERSETYAPVPISDRFLSGHYFLMLGGLQPAREADIGLILEDFDRLKPLYDYTESDETFPVLVPRLRKGFVWSPGNKARAPRRTITRTTGTVDTVHRHNLLQDAVFHHLQAKYGEESTSGEQANGKGKPVDVVVRTTSGYIYYEIKTALSARLCIREALGQLMEYSYWPDAQLAEKLVIVGEGECDLEAKKYLKTLRRKFSLPIEYRQFDLESQQFVT